MKPSRTRLQAILLIVAVVATGLVAFYAIGATSVSGLAVQVDSVTRAYNPFPPNIMIRYDIQLQVWSKAGVETRLTDSTFWLYVNGIQVGSVEASSQAFKPYNSAKYTLHFTNQDGQIAGELAAVSLGVVTVSLETKISAGWYSRASGVSISDLTEFPAVTTSGVVGRVTIGPSLMGPQPCWTSPTGTVEPSPLPVPDLLVVLQPVEGSQTRVLLDSFSSDGCYSYGTFHVGLSPGLYSISTDPCIGFCFWPEPLAHVNVEPNRIASVEVQIDTGIE